MVTVRKTGNVCVVYLDEAGRPQQFSDYDNVPEFAFPFTMDEAQAKATYGANLKFIEPPKINVPSVTASSQRMSEAQLRAQMAEMGIPADVLERLVAQGASTVVQDNYEFKPDKEVKMVRQAHEAQELVISKLRILFAKYEVAPTDPDIVAEVQYVVDFLLQIWPELLPEIEQLKTNSKRTKFVL